MNRRSTRRVLGLMSGTSCDGVDAAVVEIRGRGAAMRVELVGHVHQSYPAALRRRLLDIMAPAETQTQELCSLHAAVGDRFADTAVLAVREIVGRSGRVDLIGSHGQTICHQPPDGRTRSRAKRVRTGSTLQIGDPARIAARTGVTTVADFRQADVAAGGQGAPLVPWTDHVLFSDARRSRAVQNLGGIGNVTWLPAGGRPADVIAFDTGPGNMVIDEIVRRFSGGRARCDVGGRRAARGTIIEPVLRQWMRDPFLRRRPPKTTGREDFGKQFVANAFAETHAKKHDVNDWIATATAFTARSIADAYDRFLPKTDGRLRIDDVVVTGGGARNDTLLRMLADALPGVRVHTIDAYGIPDTVKEAISFAMLAAACVDRIPANLPQVTGANRPVVLGSVTPPP